MPAICNNQKIIVINDTTVYLPSIGCRLRNATGCNMLASGDHHHLDQAPMHWVPKVSNISMVNILVQPVINLWVPPIYGDIGDGFLSGSLHSKKYESDIDRIRQNSGCSVTALKLRPSNLLTQNDFDPSVKGPFHSSGCHCIQVTNWLAGHARPSSHCDQPAGPLRLSSCSIAADGWYSCAESCGQNKTTKFIWTCCLAGLLWKPSQRLAHETWNPFQSFR